MTPIDEYDQPALTKRAGLLQTRGLSLVPINENIPDYSRWLNDPEIVKFSELRHRSHTPESCIEYIKSFDQIDNCMWAIYAIGPDMHIGNITIHIDPKNNVAQMGMLIGEKWAWGRKYGREAWGAVMTWAKTQKIRQVEAGCMFNNLGMRRIMVLCEMVFCTTIEGHFLLDGTIVSKTLYRKVLNA